MKNEKDEVDKVIAQLGVLGLTLISISLFIGVVYGIFLAVSQYGLAGFLISLVAVGFLLLVVSFLLHILTRKK